MRPDRAGDTERSEKGGDKGRGKSKFGGKNRTSYFALREDFSDDGAMSYMAIHNMINASEKRERPPSENLMVVDASGAAAASSAASAAAYTPVARCHGWQ